MGMPSRHIPNHAFDDILSDLGDDPAIPDPHGIRKTKPLGSNPPEPAINNTIRQKLEVFQDPLNAALEVKKVGALLAILASLIGIGVAFFAVYETLKTHSQASIEDSQKHLSELKKEIGALRNELETNQDDIYKELDLLEVNIHSLRENRAVKKQIYKTQSMPHETELGRWRYLGHSQMGDSHRGFFDTGKGISAFDKGAPLLGDWHLNHIAKDMAVITHPQGKSLTLKPSKTE